MTVRTSTKRFSADHTTMARPASLSLTLPPNFSTHSSAVASPTDADSLSGPNASGVNPFSAGNSARHHKSTKSVPFGMQGPESPIQQPMSPGITSLPAFPPSPNLSNRSKDSSRGFFSNFKSRPVAKGHSTERSVRHVPQDNHGHRENLQPKSLYSLKKASGSTPDLSLSNFEVNKFGKPQSIDESRQQHQQTEKEISRSSDQQDFRGLPSSVGSDSAVAPSPNEPVFRKPKPRFANLIKRSQSIRVDADGRKSKPSTPVTTIGPVKRFQQYDGTSENEDSSMASNAPRTAPLRPDRSLRDMMGSSARGRSADRPSSNHSSENNAPRQFNPPSSASNSTSALSNSTAGQHREGASTHLFANLKSTTGKAADGLGRAGKGLLRKMERRPSSTGREAEHYLPKIIHLPLVEQTRRTRIAARLEDSKDKTEFWMPALPWRCIDYLNFKGCEEEGIYRVPGSEVQIKHWQRRFDREGDIDLFNEPDLYDINIIGSMFKSWLRDLPEEIFPKETQARIARENPDATTVPQLLKDELSMLPPWNYYLLFAITCHLSLLTAYSDKNKMTYNNLCVCFQPCLKIDAYCFRFLVERWRDCWQGCYTEKDALEDEYRVLDGVPLANSHTSARDTPRSSLDSNPEDSAIGTGYPSQQHQQHHQHLPIRGSKPPTLNLQSKSTDTPPVVILNALGPTLQENKNPTSQQQQPQQSGRGKPHSVSRVVPELAPVKPLSPMESEFKSESPKKGQHFASTSAGSKSH